MIPFATEFPIQPLQDRGAFLGQVIAWLRGTRYSKVLDDCHDTDLGGETAYLRSRDGEELRLRELASDNALEAIGFRHDYPDNDGRLWRTEAVVRCDAADNNQDLLRLRTQCIARESGARIDTPRKLYLVKTLLQDGWGGVDGVVNITDVPLYLDDSDTAIHTAQLVTSGQASHHLPVIYLSATGDAQWLLSPDEIEKLAYDVGGVAHVVVEPSRTFSFRLRDETEGANVYGGTIGIALPGQGIVRRFYLGWRLQETSDLAWAIRSASIAMRSVMPASGWDWTELQEQALRRQRERDRNRLSAEETEELYVKEINNLQDHIKQLNEQLSAQQVEEAVYDDDGLLTETLVKRIGPELYPGEYSDRLRAAAVWVCERAEQIGLDERSKSVLEDIVTRLPLSPALTELREDLKRATKDPKRVASNLTAVLRRHGYREGSDSKHIKLEPNDEYKGLGLITMPKTPSDHRSLENLRKQVEAVLGINKIPK